MKSLLVMSMMEMGGCDDNLFLRPSKQGLRARLTGWDGEGVVGDLEDWDYAIPTTSKGR